MYICRYENSSIEPKNNVPFDTELISYLADGRNKLPAKSNKCSSPLP